VGCFWFLADLANLKGRGGGLAHREFAAELSCSSFACRWQLESVTVDPNFRMEPAEVRLEHLRARVKETAEHGGDVWISRILLAGISKSM